MMRLIRSAYVIGRRDFAATVLSKAFIFFLIGPLFPLLLGGIFGSIGARVATQTERAVVAVVSSDSDFDRMSAARERVADALAGQMIVKLVHYAPEADSAAQERQLLATKKPPIRAVLTGGLTNPHLTGAVADGDPTSGQISLILSEAKAGPAPTASSVRVTETHTASGMLIKNRALTAQIGQMLLFFLTILLSGMVLSQLIEEKSNKIIEVVAAAVPIDALFIGKLFAMLAASVVGIIVWVGSGALLIDLVKEGGVQTLPSPAVGWPAFLVLGILYFAMNYLLFGAVFLTIGAQAATVREVQTLSMPVTFGQVLIFGFAATAVGAPNSTEALLAAVVPLSSPMVMLARAAEQPELWPHLVAFAWQGLWVVGILHVGAKMFRKTVLKSGPPVRWWKRRAVT
jgi:ABC-2 type transport system permease protein